MTATRSVLRVADQVAGVFPDRCVLTGVQTTTAVRQTATEFGGPRWLLGVPGLAMVVGRLPGLERCAVALPVSHRVWRVWHVRNVAAMSVLGAGITLAAIGAATGTVGLVVFGLVISITSAAYRARAHRNYWVTCRLRPSDATILIEPTHPGFDEAARDLFMRRLI